MREKLKPVDYRGLRWNNLTSPQYRHLLLLLYWPIYLLSFLIIERFLDASYTPIHCFLDDLIPFCEFFIVFYVFWYVFWLGMLAYTLLYEPETFKRLMWFCIFTFSTAVATYVIFPNCQNLRPTVFERDNVFVRITRFLYWIDTNTNVCPSLHVVASVAVVFAAHDSKRFSGFGWQLVITVLAVLISLSTVFVKQHSVVDVLAALPLCALGYLLCFRKWGRRRQLPQSEEK